MMAEYICVSYKSSHFILMLTEVVDGAKGC